MDTHRRYVEKDNEAFFLRITRVGDWLYEGADIGILVMRGRTMTDDFELTERSRKWLDGHARRSTRARRSAADADAGDAAPAGDRRLQDDVGHP